MKLDYKEMEYQANRKIEVLMQGKYCNYQFYILSLGTHPTAYVEIPKEHIFYNKNYNELDLDFNVNGGLTYSNNSLFISKEEKTEGWFIGWDYAHLGDYLGYDMQMPLCFQNDSDKKWTTMEIFEEVKNCINELKNSNKYVVGGE